MFWIVGFLALLAAALLAFYPLLRGKSLWQPAGLALIFLLPAAGMWMYSSVGTPDAIGMHPARPDNAAASEELDEMVDRLQSRLTRTPEDLDGWMLLARTLKTMQRYPEAVEALETAHKIAPENPFVMVELAEAWIFTTPDGRITDSSVFMLERALELDPTQQKALWLMGIASAQAGDDAFAISYWESLLELLEPGSQVAGSVESQINEARARLGMEPKASPAVEAGWAGLALSIDASEDSRSELPPQGVLYVMIRPPGPAVGPPIGVRRISNPTLPLSLTVTDQDSMLEERKISSESDVQVQARLSLSGSPAARSGDWQSEPALVSLASGETVKLTLDQRVE
jgi:cytochrome c-type biogenesis protein CcmH